MAVDIRLFGRAAVIVDGIPRSLTPKTMLVLIRLVAAEGDLVGIDELFRDVWHSPDGGRSREDRITVQKRISEFRRLLDPTRPGEASRIILTERGRVPAYRLMLHPGQVDLFRFRHMVVAARGRQPAAAMTELEEALALWRGRPLFDAAAHPFAARLTRQLDELRDQARHDLMRTYQELNLLDRAFDLGTQLWAADPDDVRLRDELDGIARRIRAQTRTRGSIGRTLREPAVQISVLPGDLYAETDADLVVGFTDTFDTSTRHDRVISSHSVQGQLLARLYDSAQPTLDRALRAALARTPALAVEQRRDKPHGKLTRYPIGTVAVLRHLGRRVFAVAYSRMGNDLVARSSPADLRRSLDTLWRSVAAHGQLRPVAIPVIGAGLARIGGAHREDLIETIVQSFVGHSRVEVFCPELRIVVPPDELDRIDTMRIVTVLNSL